MEDNRQETQSRPAATTPDEAAPDPQAAPRTAPPQAFVIGRLGVYLPIFVVLSALGASWAFYGMMALYGLLCLLALMGGLTAAVCTFRAAKRHGSKGLLGIALAGLILNGFLLFGIWLRDTESKTAERKELQEEAAFRESFYRNLEKTKSGEAAVAKPWQQERQSPSGDSNRAALAEQLRVASGISRDEFESMDEQSRRQFEVFTSFSEEMKKRHDDLHQATVNIFRAKMFKAASYTGRELVGDHRQLVTNFLAANHSLSNFSHHSATYLHSEMKKMGVEEEVLRDGIGRFKRKFEPRFAIQQKSFQANNDLAGVYLSALDLIEQQYEKWNAHQLDGSILLSDEAAAEKFAQLMEEIEKIKQLQTELGKEEATLVK